jgi:hypothetical protein
VSSTAALAEHQRRSAQPEQLHAHWTPPAVRTTAGPPIVDFSQRLGQSMPAVRLALYAEARQDPGRALVEVLDRLLDNNLWGPGRSSDRAAALSSCGHLPC